MMIAITPEATFTSFNIWCVGLSPDMFKDIGGDLAAYKLLLDRSLRSHPSEALDMTDCPYLRDETKAGIVDLRRKMLALDYLTG